jgi:HEAT repeat protein
MKAKLFVVLIVLCAGIFILNNSAYADRVDDLIEQLLHGKTWQERRAAAYALGEIKDPRAVEPLIQALGDPSGWVCEAAAYALGEIKDPRAVEPLIAALKDWDYYVPKAAREALVKIGKPAVEPLIMALKDEDEDVRYAAAYALGEIKDPRAVEPLIKALFTDDSSNVRYVMLQGKLLLK